MVLFRVSVGWTFKPTYVGMVTLENLVVILCRKLNFIISDACVVSCEKSCYIGKENGSRKCGWFRQVEELFAKDVVIANKNAVCDSV